MNNRKNAPAQRQGAPRPQKPQAPAVAQPKTAAPAQHAPKAPPVYQPQPVPRVLQRKTATPQQPPAAAPGRQPAAPPAYRPQPAPKVLQAKVSLVRPPGAQPPPRPAVGPQRPAALQAKLSGTIQCAFSVAGAAARNRVNVITGGLNNFDPYGGFTFAQWHPHGGRIGFDPAIVAHVVANAPHDNLGPPNWYTCPYCNWEYPLNRMQVDHIVPWAAYSALMTTAPNINAARAWEVYVGCNDPANLRLACDSCNASKGQNVPTLVWINNRRLLANAQQGF